MYHVCNIVNFAKNMLAIHHHKSCFKYDCECRYNYPALSHDTTSIVPRGESMKWYNWNGSCTTRTLFDINLKRGVFDVFSNTYCKPISNSNLMCNSNVQLLMPGPHVLYVTKYASKGNAYEESEDFEYTSKKMETRLLERRRESDFSEGFNRVITAMFIHTSGQVIGPSPAKLLTWEKQRFRFSHEFCYVPTDDIFQLLNEKSLKVNIQHEGNKTFC